jgi:hypothetical protein
MFLVGYDFTCQRQAWIEAQMRDRCKNGVLRRTGKIQAAHDSGLVAPIAYLRDRTACGYVTEATFRSYRGNTLGRHARWHRQCGLQSGEQTLCLNEIVDHAVSTESPVLFAM